MDSKFTLTVDGKQTAVTTDPQRPLLDVLREDLQLTGPKFGCGEGQCGACTVLLDGEAVRSCVTAVGDVHAKQILTIHGLATGDTLHPVQAAFLAEGAFQCGYCTSGMIMSTVGLLKRNPHPTDEQIRAGLDGNLCRCCGYARILKAAQRAAGRAGE
jgi:aerobic carbon-monoxide dehydrogenase small subunit